MGSSCMTDDIPCPQCGHPARLSVESNTCHDWNEIHCGFCGYSAEIDYDNPDQAEKTEQVGFGALATATQFGEDFWTSVVALHSSDEVARALDEMPSSLSGEHLWVRLTRWNIESKAVEIVREIARPGFVAPEEMSLDFFLPADHQVWWEKEAVQAETV